MQGSSSLAASSAPGRAERPAAVPGSSSSAERPATPPRTCALEPPAKRARTASEEHALLQWRLYVHRFPNNTHLAPDDMQEIYKTWRLDVESWMNPSISARYQNMVQQDWFGRRRAHQTLHSAFKAYLFQLSDRMTLHIDMTSMQIGRRSWMQRRYSYIYDR
jgi:hypothetical protein